MTPRDKLQLAYEIAFFPPRLHEFWNRIKADSVDDQLQASELLDMALTLHQALPESGFQSHRALQRLARYQADSRLFGTVTFLENIRNYLGLKPLEAKKVPGHLVRDIGLPEFCRHDTPA